MNDRVGAAVPVAEHRLVRLLALAVFFALLVPGASAASVTGADRATAPTVADVLRRAELLKKRAVALPRNDDVRELSTRLSELIDTTIPTYSDPAPPGEMLRLQAELRRLELRVHRMEAALAAPPPPPSKQSAIQGAQSAVQPQAAPVTAARSASQPVNPAPAPIPLPPPMPVSAEEQAEETRCDCYCLMAAADRARSAVAADGGAAALENEAAAASYLRKVAMRASCEEWMRRDALNFIAGFEKRRRDGEVRLPMDPVPGAEPAPSTPHQVRLAERSAPGAAAPSRTASAPAILRNAPRPAASSEGMQLAMDVWQSAWGDMRHIGPLLAYVKANDVTTVNLNPGVVPATLETPEGYRDFAELLGKLRANGVRRINYLYAELNYPIGAFARFIARHPELGINTIVDDSEFTDGARTQFASNMAAVRQAGPNLKYSAFITLETFGNSGVSDDLRRWGIASIDEPILMSYFGCNMAAQKKELAPFLEYAQALGRTGFVKVAILLGSKSVGRELSCELELEGAALWQFLADLDTWCRGYSSYGGLVIETNQQVTRPLKVK